MVEKDTYDKLVVLEERMREIEGINLCERWEAEGCEGLVVCEGVASFDKEWRRAAAVEERERKRNRGWRC